MPVSCSVRATVAQRLPPHGQARARRPRAVAADAQRAEGPRVLGCGGVGVDYLASVAQFPKPDDKMRTERLEVQGGGNTGNASTAAARLGLRPTVISVIGSDALGDGIVKEFQDEGVDTRGLVRVPDHPSPFTYIIVDREGATRTCIHTPGASMTPDRLRSVDPEALLRGCALAYFDGRLTEAAVDVARIAGRLGVPCLVEAERLRPGLDDLLAEADFITTSATFPQEWTGLDSLGDAVLSVLLAHPRARFVVTTLGKRGAVLVERCDAQEVPEGAGAARTLDEVLTELQGLMRGEAEVERRTGRAGAVACMAGEGRDVAVGTPRTAATKGAVWLGLSGDGSGEVAEVESRREAAAARAAALNAEAGGGGRYRGGAGMATKQAGADAGAGAGVVAARVFACTAAGLPEGAVADTTGAGDAFNGAMVYALSTGMARDHALRLAATVAAAKCMMLGARPGLPRAGDLDPSLLQ